eukprot:TRINITY_DN51468_c0_g1_i1.p1 TRINITY_DN51468_c0_g1~~TRINITY_DN51468_c0_g1_i1.p1  ORF type:complete len:101 (-),score=1.93 TRINITY_DN51468_c0_g1_i1:211-513(-)
MMFPQGPDLHLYAAVFRANLSLFVIPVTIGLVLRIGNAFRRRGSTALNDTVRSCCATITVIMSLALWFSGLSFINFKLGCGKAATIFQSCGCVLATCLVY